MWNRAQAIILACLILSPWATLGSAVGAEGEPFQRSVVYLEIMKATGSISSGTGFIVHPDGWVLTNKHVLEGATGIVARIGERVAPSVPAALESMILDPDQDLGLVRLKTGKGSPYPILDLAGPTFEQDHGTPAGREIFVAGFPRAHYYSPTFGRIVNERDPQTGRRWVVQVPASHGSSGGPVIDVQTGLVLGVFTTIDNFVSGFGTMEPISFAGDFLRANIAGWPPPASSSGSGRIVSVATTGLGRVRVHGDGGGTLKPEHLATTWDTAALNGFARMEGRGAEKTECDEDYGRRLSSAFARASIHPDGELGLVLNAQLMSNGGHYRTAVAGCLNNPIPGGSPKRFLLGLHGEDTRAAAQARLQGSILFRTSAAGRTISVQWSDFPSAAEEASARLFNAEGALVREIRLSPETGDAALSLPSPGIYRLDVELSVLAVDKGACCWAQVVHAARVRLLQ